MSARLRVTLMQPMFRANCAAALAAALGAEPFVKVDRPNLSFAVYEAESRPHAELTTELGPFAWLRAEQSLDRPFSR